MTASSDPFPRHFVSFPRFSALVVQSLPHLPRYLREYIRPTHFTAAEREKLFIATTEVLGCRHCRYIHSAIGETVTLDKEWLYQFVPDDPFSALAKGFAAQFVEVGGVQAEWRSEVERVYGVARGKTFHALLQWMLLSNLAGNTADAAMLSWRHGSRVLESRFGGEGTPGRLGVTIVAIIAAIVGGPMLVVARGLRLRTPVRVK